ncbi:hypothetical protein, partial [Dysosmobacter sp. Sow4_B12]|uniref:hypothetical protein n=1 Tax=Dysosmobacter sp. Sow4_B12 TaxID=3438777 RepID=UPI003F8F5C65
GNGMTLSISCSQFYFPEFALKPRLLPNAQPGFLDRLNPETFRFRDFCSFFPMRYHMKRATVKPFGWLCSKKSMV